MEERVKKYIADFETTSSIYYEKHGYVKVWLWAITKFSHKVRTENARVKIGYDMESFINHIMELKHRSIIFFHNLSWDGYFIMCAFKELKEKGVLDGIRYNMGSNSTIYSMSIFKGKKEIRFQCSLLLFGFMSVGVMGEILGFPKLELDYDREVYEVNEEDIEYVKRDILVVREFFMRDYYSKYSRIKKNKIKLTSSSVSKSFFRDTNNWFFYKYFVGVLSNQEWDLIKNYSYFGGLSIYKDKYINHELHNLIYLDINSMYPSIYGQNRMPCGEPIKKCPKNEERYVKLHFLKINKFTKRKDMLEMCNHFHSKTIGDNHMKKYRYLENYDGEPFYIAYWSEEWEELNKTYEIDYEIKFTYWFETTDIFMKPTQELYQERLNTKHKGEKVSIKLNLNSFYGKLGQRRENVSRIIDFEDMSESLMKTTNRSRNQLSYVPFASYTTSLARTYYLRSVRPNRHLWVYGDTDSAIFMGSEKDIKGIEIHPKKLGAWKLEKRIKRLKYLRSKAYIYENYKGKIGGAISGLNNYEFSCFEDFKYGFEVKKEKQVKKCRKKVKGGIIIVYADWSIKKPFNYNEIDRKNREQIMYQMDEYMV